MILEDQMLNRCLLLFVLALLVSSCAERPTIRADWDKTADFSAYSSYDFADVLSTNSGQQYDSLQTKYLKVAVARELDARGYKKVDDGADLEVNFHLYLVDKQTVRTTTTPTVGYGGYYGYRRGYYGSWGNYRYDTYVDDYTEGTLHIDLIDNKRDQLVWEGVAVGTVTKKAMENAETSINNVVKQIFDKYPFAVGQ